MKSRLQFAGHPLHVVVLGCPIGLCTSSLVCDGLYLLLHEAFWFRMAYWAIVFGLVTHLSAIATGLPDFLAVMRDPEQKDARRPATSHLVFGIGLLVVQGLNLAVRNGGDIPVGGSVVMPVLVNVIGATLTGVPGWYSGQLVYRSFMGLEMPGPTGGGLH